GLTRFVARIDDRAAERRARLLEITGRRRARRKGFEKALEGEPRRKALAAMARGEFRDERLRNTCLPRRGERRVVDREQFRTQPLEDVRRHALRLQSAASDVVDLV